MTVRSSGNNSLTQVDGILSIAPLLLTLLSLHPLSFHLTEWEVLQNTQDLPNHTITRFVPCSLTAVSSPNIFHEFRKLQSSPDY